MTNRLRRALRRLAWWILASVRPEPSDVEHAIRGAFADCGLNTALCTPECDLRSTGKIHEVLIHAHRRLGRSLVTVQDLTELLE